MSEPRTPNQRKLMESLTRDHRMGWAPRTSSELAAATGMSASSARTGLMSLVRYGLARQVGVSIGGAATFAVAVETDRG